MNVSTNATRKDIGIVIKEYTARFEERHFKHIDLYGEGVKDRLCGRHETQLWSKFSYGPGNRGASIRIPTQCHGDGYGYFEDRRPGANTNPYVTTGAITDTMLGLKKKEFDEMVANYKSL